MIDVIKRDLLAIQKGCKRLLTLFSRYTTMKKDLVMNVYKCEELILKIEKEITLHPIDGVKERILDWVREERGSIEKAKEEFIFQFANGLSDLLKTKGFELKGQYPNLYCGLYSIRLEFALGRVRIGWGPEHIGTSKLLPQEIVQFIERFERGLRERPFDPSDFASRLFEAYKRRLAIEGKEMGEKVSLVDLLNELVFLKQDKAFYQDPTKKNFKGYGRCMFGYDLYRLKKSNKMGPIRLYTATFDATRFKDKVIFVPEGKGGTRYGYISFEG